MQRARNVVEKAEKIIEEGEKPSASRLSRELGYPENDVHRCLNFLEREGEIETYTHEVFGEKHRLVGIKRK